MRGAKLDGPAFSYVRFSAKEQERGDSLRRQTEMRDAWLARNPGVVLDSSLTLRDLGVSAFRGRHREGDAHGLAQFLKLVEAGRIPKNALLIVENLDRLSREDELTATHLLTGLLLAGVRIVQLEPEAVFDRSADQMQIMRMVLEIGRAHAESARKSVRVGEAWDERKKRARAGGGIITAKCPAWLELAGGKFKVRPGAGAVLKRIHRMSAAGHGCRLIVATFNREKVPAWGKGKWEEAYVRKLLDSRAPLGEHQPMKLLKGEPGEKPRRVPDGEPLKGYYPVLVTEDEWFAAKAARQNRDKRSPGRPTARAEHVGIFPAMIRDALTGGKFTTGGRVSGGTYYRVLLCDEYKRHAGACVSFPLAVWERAVLSKLAEIDARDVLPAGDDGAGRVAELADALAGIEGRLAALKAKLIEGDDEVSGLMDALRALETRRKDTADELARHRQTVAEPLAESWGDARGLIGALESAPDQREARVRLRAAVARIIESVWCVVVRRGRAQLCAVQLWFKPGAVQRSYLIVHRPTHAGGAETLAAETSVLSFAGEAVLDFRERADAKTVARILSELKVPGWSEHEDQLARAREMHGAGATLAKIGEALGVTRSTVGAWFKPKRKRASN
jgi:DNA invertase Pin-like site-specific DNA recombinase